MSYYSNNANTATIVNGRVVREQDAALYINRSSFSLSRFLLVLAVGSILVITNPANELYEKSMDILDSIVPNDLIAPKKKTRQRDFSDWKWSSILNPPISITNYGIFTIEERHENVKILGLTTSWSCSFFDETYGAFCNSAAQNLCHGKPLLYDPKSYAHTAHRSICFLLVLAAIVSFCFQGRVPTSEPLLRAIWTSVGRQQFSFFTLGMDLFNASMFVYPALVRMERIIPTLQDGAIANKLNLPSYFDFILYVIVLVVFLGGGTNSLATFFIKQPCMGFDSTVAAAVAYCSAFPYHKYAANWVDTNTLISPQTVFWGYLPVTALLGGSASHVVSWLLAGMAGVMLAQYHLDNQNMWLALTQMFQSFGKL